MNADLHISDVSSSSFDENPDNPEVSQPSRPIVVDPESILAELAASESDQHRLLDSQELIELSVSENSSACSSDPGAESTPTAPLVSENSSVSIMFPRIHLFLKPLLLLHLWHTYTPPPPPPPPPPLHGLRFVINIQQYVSSFNLLIRGPLKPLV